MNFTADEIALLNSRATFDLKRQSTEKLSALMESLRKTFLDIVEPDTLFAPVGTDFSKGQIARGENYEGYPYVLLDFPKYFSGKEKFTYRTKFWYGNYFLFSLVLDGQHLTHYKTLAVKHYDALAKSNLMLGTKDVWDWRPDAALQLTPENRAEVVGLMASQPFLKLLRRYPPETLADEPRLHAAAQEFFRATLPVVSK